MKRAILEECRKGNHQLIIIDSIDISSYESKIIRWCSKCGAIVVDAEYDDKLYPGYYRSMRYPNITKRALYEDSDSGSMGY